MLALTTDYVGSPGMQLACSAQDSCVHTSQGRVDASWGCVRQYTRKGWCSQVHAAGRSLPASIHMASWPGYQIVCLRSYHAGIWHVECSQWQR